MARKVWDRQNKENSNKIINNARKFVIFGHYCYVLSINNKYLHNNNKINLLVKEKQIMSKLYKVLEHLTEGDTPKASQLFHEHVVETARKIYSEMDMYDDEEFDDVSNQGFDGFIDEDGASDDLEGDMNDLDAEEMDNMDQSGGADLDMNTDGGMGGDMGGDLGGDDLGGDMGGMGDDGMGDDGLGDDELGSDMGDEDSRIADLESAFEQLQAQFEQLTGEMGGGEDDLEGDDDEVSFDMDDDSDASDEDGEEDDYSFGSEDDDAEGEEEEPAEEPVKESIKLKPAAGGKKVPVLNKKGEKATSVALNGGPIVKGAGKPTNVNQGTPNTASYAKPSKIKTDKVKGMDNVDNNTRPVKLTPKAAPKAAKKG